MKDLQVTWAPMLRATADAQKDGAQDARGLEAGLF